MDEFSIIFISALAGIAFLFLMASQFQQIAEEKGYPEKKYFWFAFLFNIFGYMLVIALPDRNNSNAYYAPRRNDETSYGKPVNGFTSGAMDIPKRRPSEKEI